ncbi:RNA recognition motif domain-containing protein [Methanospirillum lacunae]|uniref:RNA-binding protein n=1 Tax=Methanospirillum lacunae TaxID=668570 RepID=A0A2V2N0N5_9EURY|nr:RNA-binding protein [Methanospirillum lacunae]PWR72170.1 RNA-binding protein [Methanospirillum lacunae]
MDGSKLYVGNLSYSTKENELSDLFSTYGQVVSAKIIENKGFGFVEMGSSDEAQAALDALNNADFGGRTLKIDEARPMQPRTNFGDNRSGSSSGGYNKRRY